MNWIREVKSPGIGEFAGPVHAPHISRVRPSPVGLRAMRGGISSVSRDDRDALGRWVIAGAHNARLATSEGVHSAPLVVVR